MDQSSVGAAAAGKKAGGRRISSRVAAAASAAVAAGGGGGGGSASSSAADSALRSQLEAALRSNRELQASVIRDLEAISRRKALNRTRRAGMVAKVATRTRTDGDHLPATETRRQIKRRKRASGAAAAVSVPASLDAPFFTGPDGSAPPNDNSDAVRRRELEGSTFFCSTRPPWSNKESKTLLEAIQQLQKRPGGNKEGEAAAPGAPAVAATATTLDYEEVARKYAALGEKQRKTIKKGRIDRTGAECQIQHRELLHQDRPSQATTFSKEESLRILELVHSQDPAPDWEAIAEDLNRTRRGEGDRGVASSTAAATATATTAWDCFVAYRTRLRPTPQTNFTSDLDRLLLRYAAAAGPAFVADTGALRDMLHRIDTSEAGTRDVGRVALRMHQSLANPKLTHGAWTDGDERRLCAYMKMYSGGEKSKGSSSAAEGTGTSTKNASAALSMAVRHFPRSNKTVADKWQRGLSPEYCSRPFTKREDEELMAVMRREENVGISWTDLSERHFPGRHPQRLASRFAELASDKEVLARSGGAGYLVRQRQPRSAAAAKTSAGITADDYVVQVEKKIRRK